MKTEGILLDIDGTLYNYDKTHLIALEKTFDLINKKYGFGDKTIKKTFEISKSEVKSVLSAKASSHSRLLYFQKFFEILDNKKVIDARNISSFYWETFLNSIELYEGVLNFLKNNKIPVCIITDLTADIQFKKLEHLKLYPYIEYIVTSEEAGIEKPHPFIFLYSLRKLSVNPENTIMVGDDYKKDVLGAAALGIKSFWFNPENKEINQNKSNLNNIKTFSSFRELDELIK